MDGTGRGQGPSEDDVLVEIGEIARRCALEVVDREMANDVAQDVVVMCLTRMRARRWTIERGALRGYVRRVTRGRIVDVLRETDRRRARDAEHARGRRERAQEWMDPEVALEAKEVEELGRQQLEGLPRKARITWELVREARISYEAVAKVIGMSGRGVRARLARAERRMREGVKGRGNGDC